MTELNLMHKCIHLDQSPILYDRPCSAESLAEDWTTRSAEWTYRDGAFWGVNPKAAPGVIINRGDFPGNVLVDFYGRTVLPSTHDINVMWNMTWDDRINMRAESYVAGLQGWWDGKVGIEKSPYYKLNAGAPCPWFEPGREYHIQAGSIDGHCFIFVDGELRLEVTDPEPIDHQQHTKIGIEAYQSMIAVRQIVVRQIHWTPREMQYPDEF
ncbi:MAG: hypothetical protein JW750_08500 [Anaerolineaceae bacterium]|nr:hypothetical protein [Anaerolineaceae bacterium]